MAQWKVGSPATADCCCTRSTAARRGRMSNSARARTFRDYFSSRPIAAGLSGRAARFLNTGRGSSYEESRNMNDMSAQSPITPTADQLTYSAYLRVPELIGLQHPESQPEHHDEMLFIIIHQTYELWFKQLLHELDAVIVNLRDAATNPRSRDEIYEAARLLRRCTEIARVLVEQFTILETML